MDNGGEEEEYQGDVVRRSKQDSKITEKMAAFNVLLRGKERKGSKAAATTRHDGGGREEVGESDTEGDVAKEWGGNMDNGGEEEVYQSDVVRRSTPSLCPSTIAPNNDDDPTTTSSAKPGPNTHEVQLGHPYIFHQGELVNVNVGKASYQALIVLIKNEKATVQWMTWKFL
jgi:hypothetical protein